jgi:DNA polymerase-4
LRKIIHIDMDAFYAAVEVRNDPDLAGLPVAVGGSGPRGVLMTASYEARRFGVKSAMPTGQARRLCPDLVVVRPDFPAYREASEIIRGIFEANAGAVEPLALDEAFLDVTEQLAEGETAESRANLIRRQITEATGLTASAGVSYNKFLAKIASNMAKPDGCRVIKPHKAFDLLSGLPIEAFFGIGPATARKMHELGIRTGADLQRASDAFLASRFGRSGPHYKSLAMGVDERPVSSSRNRKSVSVEETFDQDVSDPSRLRHELEEIVTSLARRIDRAGFRGQTVTLKVRTNDFHQQTRSLTSAVPVIDEERLKGYALTLMERFDTLDRPVRLIGLGVSNEAAHHAAVQLELDLPAPSIRP